MKIILNTSEDIRMLSSLNSWLNRPHIRLIKIQSNKIDKTVCDKYEKQIKSLFNDCACLWAAPVFIASFTLLYTLIDSTHFISWQKITEFFLISVFTAMISKLLGLRWSFHKLNRIIKQLNINNW